MTVMPPTIDDAQLVSGSAVMGHTLFDRSGAKLGVIKDIFIHRVTGQVEFVIGATGGFLGVGEKFHPLPWSVLTYNTTPEGYVVGVTKDAIRASPAYDRDQLSSTSYGWGAQVHRYYADLARTPARV